jgi:predicted nuclease of predicted toxin-antitoxin system
MGVLRELGFEADHVTEIGLRGHSDKEIAIYAKKKQAILITKDLELANIILYPKGSHYGLIVLRLPNNFTTKQIILSMKEFLTKSKSEVCIGTIIVLEIGRYRLRSFS